MTRLYKASKNINPYSFHSTPPLPTPLSQTLLAKIQHLHHKSVFFVAIPTLPSQISFFIAISGNAEDFQ
ncbi:hypothetical protein HanHA300_Chr09g0309761 [Helianthus annuus]|nr:hypothetical protein HanHA300_Chr09g0309761 [Helianthus annuus]